MNKKTVVVTGSFRGIGKAIAQELSLDGYHVIGLDAFKNEESYDQYICDLSSWKNIISVIENLKTSTLEVCGIINNAAMQIEKSLLETSELDLEILFKTNLFASLGVLKAFYPYLTSDSSIVNIASVHSRATSAGLGAYAASKAALSSLTRTLALELGKDKNIRVNAVSPGAVETEMLIKGLGRSGDATIAMDNLKKASPLNKIAQPNDVANLVKFLLNNNLSNSITGQEFFVDCGVLARLASE